ncbi:MAG: hypothetical protein JWO18_313 [Microbacteriaceae bacterium]|jgi:hypothetical protein|nr:hypothetical protein [Microbacteriaceae bacterium]
MTPWPVEGGRQIFDTCGRRYTRTKFGEGILTRCGAVGGFAHCHASSQSELCCHADATNLAGFAPRLFGISAHVPSTWVKPNRGPSVC